MPRETARETSRRDTEGDIYAAAVRLFFERGYYGTSLRELAKDVGIQMASLYYHFPSKQDLLMEIMTRGMQELTSSVTEAVEEESSPENRLRAGIRAHVLFHANRKMEAFVIDAELRALERDNRDLVIKLRDDYEGIFFEILRDGIRRGDFRQADARLAVNAIMAMCTGVAGWYRPGGRLSLEQIATHYTDSVLHGLLADRGEDVARDRHGEARGRRPRKTSAKTQDARTTRREGSR